MAERVILDMSREQAAIVEEACEIFMRLKLGQFDFLTETIMPRHGKDSNFNAWIARRDAANDILECAAKLMFGMNMYGRPDVGSKDEECRRALDVWHVMRHVRVMHDYPNTDWGTASYPPFPSGAEALPKCEVKSDD